MHDVFLPHAWRPKMDEGPFIVAVLKSLDLSTAPSGLGGEYLWLQPASVVLIACADHVEDVNLLARL